MSEYKTYVMQCFYHGKVYVQIEAKDIEQAKIRFEKGFDDGIELKNPEDIEPDWSTLNERI